MQSLQTFVAQPKPNSGNICFDLPPDNCSISSILFHPGLIFYSARGKFKASHKEKWNYVKLSTVYISWNDILNNKCSSKIINSMFSNDSPFLKYLHLNASISFHLFNNYQPYYFYKYRNYTVIAFISTYMYWFYIY